MRNQSQIYPVCDLEHVVRSHGTAARELCQNASAAAHTKRAKESPVRSMSTDATHILISFCNTTPGAPSLGLFELATGAVHVPTVPSILAIQKPSGIALSDRFLFVLTTRIDGFSRPSIDPPNPSGLFVFDRRTLALLTSHVCESIVDAHTAV